SRSQQHLHGQEARTAMIVSHHLHPANFYASGGVERAHRLREDAAALRQVLGIETTRIVPVWRMRSLVIDGAAPRAALLPVSELMRRLAVVAHGPDAGAVLLGFVDEAAHFAVDVAALDEQGVQARVTGLTADTGAKFRDLRAVGPLMERREGALLAYARG